MRHFLTVLIKCVIALVFILFAICYLTVAVDRIRIGADSVKISVAIIGTIVNLLCAYDIAKD